MKLIKINIKVLLLNELLYIRKCKKKFDRNNHNYFAYLLNKKLTIFLYLSYYFIKIYEIIINYF